MKDEYLNKENKDKNLKKIYLIGGSVIFTCVILLASYFIYERFTLSEEEAKNTSNRFFNMLVMKNYSDQFVDVYPNFNQIGARVAPFELPKINNISKNSDGDFEVYSSIGNIPIYLLISKSNNKAIVKSSKGINYAYYNRVLEYGKKKGCLTGNENDIEMGKIIEDKKLKSDLELETKFKINDIYYNLKITNDIKQSYGMTSGNVTIKNNNYFDIGYGDLDCIVEFYNRNGNIVSSEKLYFFEIRAQGSASSSVYSSSESAVSFKIIPTVKNTEEIKNKIRDRIIAETDFGCK